MENGVWRTIRGRRVFIKDGQSVSEAFKNLYKSVKEESELDNNNTKFKLKNLINEDGTVNETIALYGTNPDKGQYNCQRTAAVYSKRLQGEDIVAKLSEKDLNSNNYDIILQNSRTLFEGINSDKDWTWVSTKSSGIRQITKDIKNAGDGSIFLVRVAWNKNSGGYGSSHQFVGRNKGGKVIFEDPQNKTFDCMNYITKDSLWGSTAWVRVDGREIKKQYRSLIYEENKNK